MNAIMFPGQGSQFLGMVTEDMFRRYSSFLAIADDVLDFDIRAICFGKDNAKLNDTRYTQPILFLANVLMYFELLHEKGALPEVLLGHSLGEYCSLFAAGVITFEEALKLVQIRGQLMANTKRGSMAAVIGLKASSVAEKLAEHCPKKDVMIANYNSDEQTVISGEKVKINQLTAIFESLGARYIELSVSGAFHSDLMKPIVETFSYAVNAIEFKKPSIPIISNVTARPYASADEIPNLLIKQLYSPVRWVESIRCARNKFNIEYFLEVGPKNVLSNFLKYIE